MEIRLITVKDDFEKAFNLLNQDEYPLSFYEFVLKHDQFANKNAPKLIGIFKDDECIGHLSYVVRNCPIMDQILDIREIRQTNIQSYKAMMGFIDILAKEENCRAIKISKKQVAPLNVSIFDRFENLLKSIVQ